MPYEPAFSSILVSIRRNGIITYIFVWQGLLMFMHAVMLSGTPK